ncbi:MAG: 1-deoxy-D-xylulose-5-phosphate synthase [Clostridia bacterium]|nr:1-deoxy-D-xylulose-5-phosphate synthase [Clostridia bacterium]
MKDNDQISENTLLSKIENPKDLNKIKNLDILCNEIRKKLIEVVSNNGGHLASNLGVVELTVSLCKIFNSPEDKIVWDVSHQSYVHKMLTGRLDKIDTIRKENGISGFTNRKESPYDAFTQGHSSASISAALGLASAKKINKESGHTVAVIGDGALTGGLAYEGLNNAGRFKKNFIIVLNDNQMSISKNVGAVARYLAAARIRPSYMKAKNAMEKVLNKTSIGIRMKELMKHFKSVVKKVVNPNNIFEDMGFVYYGPIDGHNLKQLEKAFIIAKSLNKPTVVHVIKTKGKGYKPAEENPGIYHGVSSFDAKAGVNSSGNSQTFSSEFGRAMCKIAEKNPKVCAITAAMTSGTGLKEFKNKYKKRFFDVGIAEEHAVTFAGGLAAGGMVPVVAVYSTFLQRSYDQIIHDAALQNLKVVFGIDRAGLTGEDGETHQGIFDVPFLNTIPDIKIYSPSFIEEMEPMLNLAINNSKNLVAIRYPRGTEFRKPGDFAYTGNNFDIYGEKNAETLIVTYGRLFSNAIIAQQDLDGLGIRTDVLKFNVIKPIDGEAVKQILKYKNVIFFEESFKSGAVAEKLGSVLLENNFKGNYFIKVIDDGFVKHASVESQMKKYSLDSDGMKEYITKKCYTS